MNASQIHLIVNHWPLILFAVGFFILLYGELKNFIPYKNLGLLLFVIAALFAIATQFSGGAAIEVLQEFGIDEKERIEHHEGFGFWSAMLAYGVGILSFISLFMVHNLHPFFSYLRKFILVLAIGGLVLMSIAAHTGGAIQHIEIR